MLVRGDRELLGRIAALDGRLQPAAPAARRRGAQRGLRLPAMSLRFLPNLLCVLRILLVYPVAHGILQGHYSAGAWRCSRSRPSPTRSTASSPSASAGTASSARCSTRLADKLLLVTVFICLSVAGLAPWWLAALVLLRDLVILFGALTYKWLFGPLHGAPTAASKFNTLCADRVLPRGRGATRHSACRPAARWSPRSARWSSVTTAVSGIDYVADLLAARRRRVARARRRDGLRRMQQLPLRRAARRGRALRRLRRRSQRRGPRAC